MITALQACMNERLFICHFDNVTYSLSMQGSSIYSDTAAANYGDPAIFENIKPRVPAYRLGTVEEVGSFFVTCFYIYP